MLEEAIRLRELGFAVHWLQPRSKAPVESGWPQATVMDVAALKRTYRPGYNVGFRAGKWSVVDGDEICTLDIDVRGGQRYAEEAYAAAKGLLGDAYRPTVQSGSGFGMHQHLRVPIGRSPAKAAIVLRQSDVWVIDGRICAANENGARPAWQIEFLSTGKNVVLPPSIHPATGQPYAWINGVHRGHP